MRRHLLGSSLLVSIVIGVAAPATATPPQEGAEPTNREAARAAYLRGKAHYDVGRFEAAVRELKQAYGFQRLSPLLRYTADAYYAMRRYGLALSYYRLYLERARHAPDKVLVGHRVRELETFLSSEEEQPIAGRAARQDAPRLTPLTPDGRDRELPRELAAELPVEGSEAPRSRALQVAKWSALAAGVAGLALGITYNRMARSRADQLEASVRAACPEGTPDCGGNPGLDRPVAPFSESQYALEREVDRYNKRSLAFLVVGGVAAVTSAVLFVVDRPRARRLEGARTRSLALGPLGAGSGLGVAGEVSF
jgi:tetratricopeptide (TPR) repeat protein